MNEMRKGASSERERFTIAQPLARSASGENQRGALRLEHCGAAVVSVAAEGVGDEEALEEEEPLQGRFAASQPAQRMPDAGDAADA